MKSQVDIKFLGRRSYRVRSSNLLPIEGQIVAICVEPPKAVENHKFAVHHGLMIKYLLLILCLAVSGCAAKSYYIRESRVAYQAKSYDGLLVSNSPMFTEKTGTVYQTKAGLQVKLSLLLANARTDKKEIALRLGDSVLELEKPQALKCTSSSNELIQFNASVKITCEATLQKDQLAFLKMGDQMVNLKIPFEVGNKQSAIETPVKFRSEDLQ